MAACCKHCSVQAGRLLKTVGLVSQQALRCLFGLCRWITIPKSAALVRDLRCPSRRGICALAPLCLCSTTTHTKSSCLGLSSSSQSLMDLSGATAMDFSVTWLGRMMSTTCTTTTGHFASCICCFL